MKRCLVVVITALAIALGFPGTAFAQSGHFIEGGAGAPVCRDIGTQVQCTGKVAGLGGTTFTITVEAKGVAEVECINPGGNVAPGQDTVVTVKGTTKPLPTPRNGQFVFSIATLNPEPLPATPTCPNRQWTPKIIDVTFTGATLTLREDGAVSDRLTVTVGP